MSASNCNIDCNFCNSPANHISEANDALVSNNPQNFLLNWPRLNSQIHPSATDIVRNGTLQDQFHLTRPHLGTIPVESLPTSAVNPSQKKGKGRSYHAQKGCTYHATKGAKRKAMSHTFLAARKTAVRFPAKLMQVLSSKQCEHIIAWTRNGSCFVIKKPSLLVKEVLPFYFKEAKYTSFTRKLHRWGFVKTNLKDSSNTQTIYFHKYFQRGDPDLCEKMDCSNRGGPRRHLPATDTGGKMAESGRRSDYNLRSKPNLSSAGAFEAPIINSCSPQITLFERSFQDEQSNNHEVQGLDIHSGSNYTQHANMLSISAHEMRHNQKVTGSNFQRMKRQEQHHRSRRLGERNMEHLTRQGQQLDSDQVSFANDLSSDGMIILRAAYEFMISLSAMRRQGGISTDAACDQFTSQVEQQRKRTQIRPREASHSSTMTAPSA
eukprot:209695_1